MTVSAGPLKSIFGVPAAPPQFLLSRWIFLRLLGAVYLIAFASLASQIAALVGEDGLLPAEQLLERGREIYGAQAFYRLPTLAWLSASDRFLQVLCWCGVFTSLLVSAGVAPIPALALLWTLYLSLTVIGQTFLSFQWDVLLLEAGLLACLYAPRGWWPRLASEHRPSAAIRWLLWGLAFKLTFLSGITKLVSRDPTWANWTALSYHYETQPIPSWTSWYAHHQPQWFHEWSVAALLFIELVVPFFVFAPSRFRSIRVTACALLTLLQLGIAATGNYGFFNLLTLVLYVSLLDDKSLRRLLPRRLAGRAPAQTEGCPETRGRRVAIGTLATLIAIMSALTLAREATYTKRQPAWSSWLLAWVAPFRSINGYGLFRVMTTERPEIVIEGSLDQVEWKEYAFRWKPGDPMHRPTFVAPHQPRLDWQMWFAALDPATHERWLVPLLDRLLDGSPDVLALLGENPFPDSPPRYVRLAYYRYRFASSAERAATGVWWRREFLGYLTGNVSREAPLASAALRSPVEVVDASPSKMTVPGTRRWP